MNRSNTKEAGHDDVNSDDDNPTTRYRKKSRHEEQHQGGQSTGVQEPLAATGGTVKVTGTAPVQILVPSNHEILRRPIESRTDDIALKEMCLRRIDLLNNDTNDALECYRYALSQDRDALRSRFQQLTNSSSILMTVFTSEEDFATIKNKIKKFLDDSSIERTAKEQIVSAIEWRKNATINPAGDTLNDRSVRMDVVADHDPKSGLLYIEQSHMIVMEGVSTDAIGIFECFVMGDKRDFRHRLDLEILPPCASLQEAWSWVDDENLSKSEFITKLTQLLTSLDPKILGSAWHSFQTEFPSEDIDQMGEMALQQFVYPPFAYLFKAVVGSKAEDCYKADQDVRSSLSVQYKEKEDDAVSTPRRIIIQPDGAAIMDNEGWDVLGMMELKNGKPSNKRANRIDYDKCVLATAIAALAVKRCIQPKDYHRVAIPFLIATGGTCSLFATTLDKNGNPFVKIVGYPGYRQALQQRFTTSCCRKRTEIFTALAVLLNQSKSFFNDFKEQNNAKLEQRTHALQWLPRLSLNSKSKDSDSRSGRTRTQNSGHARSRKSNEDSALEAAECNGQFVNLEHANLRTKSGESGSTKHEKVDLPFFFTANPASSCNVLTKNKVFLKVWNTEKIKMHSVRSEWMHYKQAWEAGVPVAVPALQEIAVSTSSCGTTYVIIAVEYIQQDQIRSMKSFVHFCYSLVDTVDQLHIQAKLLHCDIKPDNLRWRDGVVRLIDFEHAQPIRGAKCKRGTKGFEAPEILNGKFCSTKTDAFAVGKTILVMLEAFLEEARGSHEFGILHDVALKLTCPDPQARWCLNQALIAIQNIMLPGNDSSSLIMHAMTAANPVTASPYRRPSKSNQNKK